jgi:hypothetical protein
MGDQAAVRRHSRARNYRVADRRVRIEIYERVGPDVEAILPGFISLPPSGVLAA